MGNKTTAEMEKELKRNERKTTKGSILGEKKEAARVKKAQADRREKIAKLYEVYKNTKDVKKKAALKKKIASLG